MKVRFETNKRQCYFFDYSTGKSILIGERSGNVRNKGPNLLDVSITNRCNKGCDFCYRNSASVGNDITLADYQIIIDNAKLCGVQQIAIGGGEPTLHPHFCDILEITRSNGIIPNYSTNADNLSDPILFCTKKCCGAIAISVYGPIEEYREILRKVRNYGITVNFHMILRSDKITEYTSLLQNPPVWLSDLNAIIFLNYKPANGNESLCFKKSGLKRITDFFEAVATFHTCGVGFDTCSASYLREFLDIDGCYYDYCEGARRSAFINEKLDVYPCSFYTKGSDSLRNNSLKWIWDHSDVFIQHRKILTFDNERCKKNLGCIASCPLYRISAYDK